MATNRTSAPAAHVNEYDDLFVARLELIWGEGFMSPGGAGEVARVLEGVELTGKRVLDLGCGTGGVDLLLVRDHGAGEVLGIDVEEPLIARARRRIAEAGLADRVSFQLVDPGPFPLDDAGFDVVFSKDAMIHIPDKPALFREALRVLRPGGAFAASDWLQSADARGSPQMARFGEALGLTFNLATEPEMAEAMAAAGFAGIETRDRNAWFRAEARGELTRIEGPLRARVLELIGQEKYDRWIAARRLMCEVLDKGFLRPTHLLGRKIA